MNITVKRRPLHLNIPMSPTNIVKNKDRRLDTVIIKYLTFDQDMDNEGNS